MVRRLGRVLAAWVLVGGLAGVAVIQQASSAGAVGGPVAFTILDNGDAECQLAHVDLSSGVITTIGPLANDRCVAELAEAPDGRLFGIREDDGPTVHLIQFDTTTGAPTDLGPIGSVPARSFGEGGIAFDPAGALFVAMAGDDPGCAGNAFCLYRVDAATPANATFLGIGTPETDEQFLTVSCGGTGMILSEGEQAGSANFGAAASDTTTTTTGDVSGQAPPPAPVQAQTVGDNALLNARNLANGAMTPIGTGLGDNNLVTGIEFDSTGALWGIGAVLVPGAGHDARVFTVNSATGVATAAAALTLGGVPLVDDTVGLAMPLTCPTSTPLPRAAFTG